MKNYQKLILATVFQFVLVISYAQIDIRDARLQEAMSIIKANSDRATQIINQLIEEKSLSASDHCIAFYTRGFLRKNTDLEGAYWDYREAVRYLEMSNEKKKKALDMKARIFNDLGGIHAKFFDYEIALEYFENALKLETKIKNHVLYNVGKMYTESGNLDLAKEILTSALDACGDDLNLKTKTQSKIGNVYADMGDYEKAIDYQMQIINTSKNISSKYIASAHHNLAYAYTLKGDTTLAMQQLQVALSMKEGSDRFNSLEDLAELYLYTGELQLCIETGHQAEGLFTHQSSVATHLELLRTLAKAYRKLGQMDTNEEYVDKYIALSKEFNAQRERMKRNARKDRIRRIEQAYEQEIALREQAAYERKMYRIAGVALLVFVLFTLYFIHKKRKFDRKNKKWKKLEDRAEKRLKELTAT